MKYRKAMIRDIATFYIMAMPMLTLLHLCELIFYCFAIPFKKQPKKHIKETVNRWLGFAKVTKDDIAEWEANHPLKSKSSTSK